MKKYINIALIALAVFAFSSCEDFLDKEPIDQLGEGGFYSNDEELNMAVMACYSGLRSMANEEWRLSEIRSDNARLYIKNTGDAINVRIRQLDNFTVETTHDENQSYWQAAYKAIDNCNVVLENIDVVADVDLKNQLEGEARFIRAYIYFNLVRLYGPVFLVSERLSIEDGNNLPRSSVQDVYNLIENDLSLAAGAGGNTALLPPSYDSSELGRATSWAAKTMLAKVYLTLNRYADAKPLLIEVKNNSGHELLLGDYAGVFDINNEMNKEIIFAVRYLSGGYGQGSPFANYFSPRDGTFVAGRAYNYNTPTNDLIEAYNAAGDEVRKNVVMRDTWIDDSGNLSTVPFVTKYFSAFENELDAENDWIVLRYADVLLMLAEVENETSTSAALPYLNDVRTRVNLDPVLEDDVPTPRDMMLAIEKERRLEFAFENQRYYDLLRTNRLTTIMEAHYNAEIIVNSIELDGTVISEPYYAGAASDMSYLREDGRKLQEWQFLLPIPNGVMTVATNATQNPGY